MPWFKVDDSFPLHPKVIGAGNAAIGLWVRAGTWSMHQLTDGWIPIEAIRILGTKTEANRLVRAGLWDVKPDGYQFHDWDQYQPSRVKVICDREDNRKKLADWRAAKRTKAKGATSDPA